jgi:chromosome segregation ATPase
VQAFKVKNSETAQQKQCLCALLVTKGKLHDLQNLLHKKQNAVLQNEKEEIVTDLMESLEEERKIRRETEEQLKDEIEGLKKQKTKLQNEKDGIVTGLEKSLQVEREMRKKTEEQFTKKKTELNDYQISQGEMLNEIEALKKQKAELQSEKGKIVMELEKSLQVEREMRKELEGQLTSKETELHDYQTSQGEMLNEIQGLKKKNTELTMERDKTLRILEEFRLWIEGFDSSTNHLEENFTEFTQTELRKVTNDFNDSLKIGEGGYGSVYKAFLGLKPVAIKILSHESQQGKRQFNQEVVSTRTLICLCQLLRYTTRHALHNIYYNSW